MRKIKQNNLKTNQISDQVNYKSLCDQIFFSKEFQNILTKKINLLASEVKFQFYQQLKNDIQNINLYQEKNINNKSQKSGFYNKDNSNIRNYTQSSFTRSASNNNYSDNSEQYNIFDNPLPKDQINNYVNSFINKIKINK